MATFEVTSTADSGAGSLREAIGLANASAGADTITFAAGLAGDTIRLQSTLAATETLAIDGNIDGDAAPDITITGDANGDDTTVAGGITDVFATPAGDLDDNVQIISSTATLALDGLVLTGGRAMDTGGAVGSSAAVEISNSTVSGNSAERLGGGIASRGATLTDSTVSGNRAGDGGGVFAGNFAGDTATLVNSTVSGNSAEGFAGGGGGILANIANLTNSTVSGNSAHTGGGVWTSGTATLTNSTVSGNSAVRNGGGINAFGGATLVNSIVLGNGAGVSGSEVFGATTTIGGNILGTNLFQGSTDVGDTTAADVFAAVDGGAGVLADNGGPVQTIALRSDASNPALDASNPAAPATDARGRARVDQPGANPNGDPADLGAYELTDRLGANENPPVITSNGGRAIGIAAVRENTTAVTTVTAADADGDALSYSIVGGPDRARFQIDPVTGALAFIAPPDFENPGDLFRNNIYEVAVRASDGTFSDTQLLVIGVLNQRGVTINGTNGDDVINATQTVPGQPLPTDEEDTIAGRNGDDQIQALGGNDRVSGGGGNDAYIFRLSDGDDRITETSGAADAIRVIDLPFALAGFSVRDTGGGSGDLVIELDDLSITVANHFAGGGRIVETLTMEHGIYAGFSVGGAYRLVADDTGSRDGGPADDIVAGNASANTLTGGGGRDSLFGNGGADRLVGGADRDLLVGGAAADVFDFDAVSASIVGAEDVIADFGNGADRIDLATIDAVPGGANDAFVFAGQNAGVVANSVTWFEAGGETRVQLDNSGDTTADMIIRLAGTGLGLAGDDFIL